MQHRHQVTLYGPIESATNSNVKDDTIKTIEREIRYYCDGFTYTTGTGVWYDGDQEYVDIVRVYTILIRDTSSMAAFYADQLIATITKYLREVGELAVLATVQVIESTL